MRRLATVIESGRIVVIDLSRYGACVYASRTFQNQTMSKLLRGVAAGYGAKKLGGGCFSTVIIFIILWLILGHFGIFK